MIRHKHRDPVAPELVEALRRRDIGCVLSFLDDGHQCTDRWGDPCDWRLDRAPWAITVEHVKSELRMGVPSRRQRGLIRHYLEIVSFASDPLTVGLG